MHDEKVLRTLDIEGSRGLNFVSYDLSKESSEKSSKDNGLHYLSKGEYVIRIIQGDNTSDGKLIIN